MADRRVRGLFLGGAFAAALAAGSCSSSPELSDAKDLLWGIGSTLNGTFSADYDPPDYDGPPLGYLPRYQLGDAFTYSSGRTETVVEIIDERIVWRNDLQSEFERYPNFVLPTLVVRNDKGVITRTVDAPPDVLWPLIPGTRRKFESLVNVRRDGEQSGRLFRRDWICTVVGPERVSLQFGDFDGVEISCTRYSRGRWRQTRTWYYVPEIGHYVRRIDRIQGREPLDIQLVSIQQAPNGLTRTARRALYELEQDTLERLPSGKAARWQSSEGDVAITMTVTKTMQTEAGQFCRVFRQEIRYNGVDRLVPGLACRTWNGRWVRL
ncbi:MAG: hypothetical protein JSU82_12085 [Rhodospirillales bacterium]|nr:MAG: hypothetical protein JSU82_12085 [Rhodospirillales bacterium]